MKSFKTLVATLIATTFLFISVQQANCSWVGGNSEEEEITLEGINFIRVDVDPDAPLHEQNQGAYGYYDECQVFHLVLDFSTSQIIQAPYNWDCVQWVPGPFDKPVNPE